jgi:hypothetical protein
MTNLWNNYASCGIEDVEIHYFVSFFAFGFCLLFCMLVCLMFVFQWSSLSELVSMMEYIPCYYVYGECES